MPKPRWFPLVCLLSLTGVGNPATLARAQLPPGANSLQTPVPEQFPATTSAADLFAQLAAFSPLPAAEVRREVRHPFWTNRVRLALNFGALVGDGFLIVQARDRARVTPLGRELLRRARALGVGSALAARAQSLEELGEAGRWEELRTELAGAQGDVEAGLAALRDKDLVGVARTPVFSSWTT